MFLVTLKATPITHIACRYAQLPKYFYRNSIPLNQNTCKDMIGIQMASPY